MPSSSSPPPPLISAPRITTLIACLIVATSAGTRYVYSGYSPQLGARLHISHTQLNFIGVSASFGSLSSPMWGRIIDSHGPRIPLACSFLFHIIGYAWMKQLYDAGLPPHAKTLPMMVFVALFLCTLLAGSGGVAADIASVNSTAKTFPDRARGSTTGLVISGYGLSPLVFTSISHFFFASNTSAFLLVLTLGTSIPMIMGFFLVRPIPLPIQDASDIEEGHNQLQGISSALQSHSSTRAPLLDHDDLAGGLQSSNSAVFRTGMKGARIDREVYALDDIPFPSANGVFSPLSSYPRGSNGDVAVPTLNLHGRQLYASTDFWLLFTILAILSGTGLMYINNVGTISQVLYAHKNSKYDKVKASSWQASQVSLISFMSFLGRLVIGIISDLVKNKYKLPRSYLLVPIAVLFFISQLMLAIADNITQLWIASSLLGLAHGSLYSLYPTVCLEWFGMAHFSENWGYLSMSLLAGGNLFSLVFGHNLDAHDRHHSTTTSHSHLSSIDPVQCLKGLDCYVSAVYLTIASTLVSIVLCYWAGYREKQKIAKL